MVDEPVIEIYTDGACRGNPGPGGWAALLRINQHEKKLAGFVAHTTNNRMELMAPIQALAALKQKSTVVLVTDSQYVKRGITEWILDWKKRNWRTSSRKPVKNVDLWQQLDDLTSKHSVEWKWVRGHSGVAENELVDQLACAQIDKGLLALNK
ncbi:MAG: ribonuclease HI [Gammaproteobacteria bacterium]|nr:ribonuclease HI [Gammaproteobacteria bacterium]